MDTEYRQVVSDMSITSSKGYNDFLYGWLVLNAQIKDGVVYWWKRDFVLSKLEKELGMTRKTLSKYFSFLVKEGLVREEKDKWVIVPLEKKGFWIEENVLKRLVECKKKYMISVYVYLRKGYWVAGKKQLFILLDNVKVYLGLATTTRSNNEVVTELFKQLSEQGFLKCELKYNPEKQRHFYLLSGVDKVNYF